MRDAASFPVAGIVVIDGRSGAQQAEECVLRSAGDDASVAAPDDQVSGLGMGHSLELVNPRVEVGRTRVLIGETSAFIQRVNKVRAIVRSLRTMAKIQSCAEDCETLIGTERLRCGRPLARVAVVAAVLCVGSVLLVLLLRLRGGDGQQAQEKKRHHTFGEKPHSIL